MARIRSIHPGLFTDEAFVNLSHAARLLFIGILTECDDNGIFEWKPIVLHMRIFAGDTSAVRVPALLDELLEQKTAMKFDVEGKYYGAIRNFRKWQRPKKPTYKFPLTEESDLFSGLPEVRPDSTERSIALGKILSEKQDHECFYCESEITFYRKKPNSLQVDHRIPIRRGGPDEIENLVASCKSCNMLKGTLTDVEFLGKFTKAELRERCAKQVSAPLPVTHWSDIPRAEEGGRRKEGVGGDSKKKIDKPSVVVVPREPEKSAGTTTTTQAENDLALQGEPAKPPVNPLGTALPEEWIPDDDCMKLAFDSGMDGAEVESEVIRFHALNAQRGTFSQNWNKTWTLWCAEFKRRKAKEAAKAPPRVEVSKAQTAAFAPTEKDWDSAAKLYAQLGRWNVAFGPEPTSPACKCPPDILAKYIVNHAAVPVLAARAATVSA